MRNQQHFTLFPSPDSCKERGARLISVALCTALGLFVVSLLSVVAYSATPSDPAEAPAELPREWRFEHKVVEFDDMFGGSRQIELRTKR